MSLSAVYKKYSAPDSGGDKGTAHSYIKIYETELDKTENVALLEIGVWEGHSLAMWQEYLSSSLVIGVDINLSKVIFDLENTVLADATKPISKLEGLMFDYIIDDGSHKCSDQLTSFGLLWDKVKPGGKYIIEDIVDDSAVQQIVNTLESKDITYRIYDCRSLKSRSDDILIVAVKR